MRDGGIIEPQAFVLLAEMAADDICELITLPTEREHRCNHP